jgi:TonB family protein
MASNAIRNITILILSVALIAGSISAATLDSKHDLIGLGLHEETGRKIYLGGIYLPRGTSRPQDLKQLSSPMLMEYRVVARRTSIRSLLGGMLLQSEVATGQVPSQATTLFADRVLSNVKTSLYAGDSLVIGATTKGETLAFLNGHRLARVKDGEVAHYLLMGWISENGPTAIFRRDLMAVEIDPSMLSVLAATHYPAKREAQVAAWFAPAKAEPEPAAPPPATSVETIALATQNLAPPQVEPVTASTQAAAGLDKQITVASSAGASAAAALLTPVFISESEGGFVGISTDGYASTPADEASVEPASQASPEALEEIQTASLIPFDREPQEEDETLALGVQEYSRRLSVFHGSLVSMVHREIRYPKRAVRRNLQGRLELDLTLQNTGELVAVIVSQSSGHKLLDKAAVKAAQKAFNSGALGSIDPVAIAEFGSDPSSMVIPIPVSFQLAE